VDCAPPRNPLIPGPLRHRAECNRDGDPVDLGTGQFVLTKTDVALPGPLPIVLRRAPLSASVAIGMFLCGNGIGSLLSTRLERIQWLSTETIMT
jgi:hypothetical protein